MKIKITPNRIIRYLILSDFAFWTGWGLVTPIFAVFVVDKIQGGTVIVVGIASAIYWILKSLFEVPIAIFLDTIPSERDDYFTLVAGTVLGAVVPFGYVFASIPLHIYILQGFHALGMAMALSGWRAIFTRHIDEGREATEWSLDSTTIGIGTGIAGGLGGWLVSKFGFDPIFIGVGLLGLLSVVILISLRKSIRGVFEKDILDHGIHSYLKEVFHRATK